MFMEFSFNIAAPADDPALRQLLAANPMPGHITVTFEREPDYFVGCGTMGHFYQVITAKHQPDNELAGVVCRSTRPLFINGQVEEVGYLSQLRIDQRFRGRWLLRPGARYLRHLHADDRAPAYLAAIIEGNDQAHALLVKRSPREFPLFHPICRLWTLSLVLRGVKRIPVSSYQIHRGTAADISEIVALLRQHGAAKQFFPVYREADFDHSSLTPGFQVKDFMLAREKGKLVGVIGLWDQSAYKQTVVQAYSGALNRLRPLYNLGLRLVGARPLPAPGQKLPSAYASFSCIANNNPAIFDVLLRHLYNLAVGRGYAYLMVSLTEADPLLTVARCYWHIPYRSQLYVAGWEEAAAWSQCLDGRIPFMEPAAM
jgi:hypothetical protein